MHRLLLHNGEIRDAAELSLSPGQTGFLTGWGVFSTIRVYEGVLFAWERHFARMLHDAAKMRVPFPADAAALKRDLEKLLQANRARNATLRVNVVRNHGGLFQGHRPTPAYDVIAFTADVNAWGDSVRLGVIPHARHAGCEFAGVKYTSWAQNLTWYERAREQGLDEMVLLNERSEVSECTSANLFVATGNAVYTPPLSSGCLPGVTRAVLLEEIRPANGIRVAEKTLFPADLERADEVFVTSTTRELLPVVEIQGLNVRGGRGVCDALVGELKRYVQDYVCARNAAVPVS